MMQSQSQLQSQLGSGSFVYSLCSARARLARVSARARFFSENESFGSASFTSLVYMYIVHCTMYMYIYDLFEHKPVNCECFSSEYVALGTKSSRPITLESL